MNSVRPISVIGKQRVGQANSVGPITHFGETKMLQKGTREFTLQSRWDRFALSVGPKSYERETESLQPHLGGTEIPIGETELIRVSGSGDN